jgi:hypothetical protein
MCCRRSSLGPSSRQLLPVLMLQLGDLLPLPLQLLQHDAHDCWL